MKKLKKRKTKQRRNTLRTQLKSKANSKIKARLTRKTSPLFAIRPGRCRKSTKRR